jgi:hypothetical protein
MDKLTELCEFLAWVQDNYTKGSDDCFHPVNWEELEPRDYTREEVVTHYLMEKGVSNA